MNKNFYDTKLAEVKGHISYLERVYIEFKLHNSKQYIEEVSIDRAAKTTTQILYDKRIIDNYDNADEVLKEYLFVERRRPDLEEVNDDVIQLFCSYIQFR